MTSEDGYAARPPGAYTPTERTGTNRRWASTPGYVEVDVSRGRWGSWNARTASASRRRPGTASGTAKMNNGEVSF